MNKKLIKTKLQSGEIVSWSDIYDYTTPQEMAIVLGRNAQHWGSVKNKPLMLTIEDMEKIMQVFRISRKKFLELVGGVD